MKKISLIVLALSLVFSTQPTVQAKVTQNVLENVIMILSSKKNSEEVMVGTGFLIAPHGYVLTAEHVIRGGDFFAFCGQIQGSYEIQCAETESLKLLAKDETLDLALLKVPASVTFDKNDLDNFLMLGNSDLSKIGDEMNVIGYPENGFYTLDLRKGIISGFVANYIKTDAKLSPGNSGGPAMNENNEVVGMANSLISDEYGTTGLLIKSNDIREWLEKIGYPTKQLDYAGDLETDQFKEAILELYEQGIVQGYADGTFKPENKINRAELTKIIVEAVYPSQAYGFNCFPDVKEEWFAMYVCYAKEKGIINGNADGMFHPMENVNYVEALKLILESFNFKPNVSAVNWYDGYVEIANNLNLGIVGVENNEEISRGMMAQLISHVLKYKKEKGFLFENEEFSINFPGEVVDYSSEIGKALVGEDAKAFAHFRNANEIFVVAYGKIEQENDEEDIANSLDGVEIEESVEKNYGRYRGAFLKMKGEDGFHMIGQVYFVKGKLFEILVIKNGTYPDEKEAKKFIDSFKLKIY